MQETSLYFLHSAGKDICINDLRENLAVIEKLAGNLHVELANSPVRFASERSQIYQRNRISKEERFLKMRKQKGFSLIELLIVVAIILIIAAIAIPNLLRARISANDSAAAATIRTINTAEVTYQTSYNGAGYAPALANLGPDAAGCVAPTSIKACLLDNLVGCAAATCPKGGYNYFLQSSVATLPDPDYTASASPIATTTGSKNFCSNPDAVVRFNSSVTPIAAPGEILAGCNTIGAPPNTTAGQYMALQ
jgi:type IV pilus assembly protein PilA